MGATEGLLTFYERFRLLFDNCNMLGIEGFTDESAGARLFYSKLDAGRYGQLYREKLNSVARKMDTWSQSISEAYSEIDRWIPPKHTDANRTRPTAFNAIASNKAPWTKSPCNVCGKLGHWKRDCPDIKESPNGDMQRCNQKN